MKIKKWFDDQSTFHYSDGNIQGVVSIQKVVKYSIYAMANLQ